MKFSQGFYRFLFNFVKHKFVTIQDKFLESGISTNYFQ